MFEQSLLSFVKSHADLGTAIVGLTATVGGYVAAAAAKQTDSPRTKLLQAHVSEADATEVAAASDVSAGSGTLQRRPLQTVPVVSGALSLPKQSTALARRRIDERLVDAAEACKIQVARTKRSRLATSTLNVAQYILGVIIASSFIQQHLNPTLVGSMGVMVLVASAIKDKFRPDVDAEDASRKSREYSGLIETVKDELVNLDTAIAAGSDRGDEMTSLMKSVTRRMTEIENSEVSKPQPALEAPKS